MDSCTDGSPSGGSSVTPVSVAIVAPPASEQGDTRWKDNEHYKLWKEQLNHYTNYERTGKGGKAWQMFKPVLIRDEATGEPLACKLQCKQCPAQLSAKNPSARAKEHKKCQPTLVPVPACDADEPALKKLKQDVAAAAASKVGEVGGQQKVNQYFVSAAVAQDIRRLLALAIFEECGSVPLRFTESPRIKELFSKIGVQPMARHTLAGTMLDKLFKEAKQEANAVLKAVRGGQVRVHLLCNTIKYMLLCLIHRMQGQTTCSTVQRVCAVVQRWLEVPPSQHGREASQHAPTTAQWRGCIPWSY